MDTLWFFVLDEHCIFIGAENHALTSGLIRIKFQRHFIVAHPR